MNNKKLMSILLVVVLAFALITAYNVFLKEDAVEGSKEVEIRIVVSNEEIDETFTYRTDADFLEALLKEKQEEISLVLEDTDYGPMVIGLMGYTADVTKNEFYNISVNGESAMTGIADIVVNDGDAYLFELTTW